MSSTKGLVSFTAAVKESDLFISAESNLSVQAMESLSKYRRQIEEYSRRNLDFLTALVPLPDDSFAPGIVRSMLSASAAADVGPMAGVAGAVAEYVAKDLLQLSSEVIIENGGDVYLSLNEREGRVAIFAGSSPLSDKMVLSVKAVQTPCAVCTSSATVGPSLSFGKADAVCVLSPSAVLADAVATSLCNRIHHRDDIKKVLTRAQEIKGIGGVVIIVGDALGAWGDIEFV